MVERVKLLTLRIRKILEGSRICAVETANQNNLISSLSKTNEDIGLVLMDLDIEQKYAMDLLIETRKRVKSTPIIIMTSEPKKTLFVEAMLQGATDFIIKPFTDQLLVEKIQKYLVPPDYSNTELITMDLNQYVRGELRKAEKGKFPLSLMFMYFENNSSTIINEHETNNFVFNNMKKLFWDTDLFIRFASEHGLGIFPFCSDENTVILKTKIESNFDSLKTENDFLKDYNMICAFVTYPSDTTDIDKVFNLFINRINEKFLNISIPTQENS